MHVMSEEQREYYDMESFYGAAEEVCSNSSIICAASTAYARPCFVYICTASAELQLLDMLLSKHCMCALPCMIWTVSCLLLGSTSGH